MTDARKLALGVGCGVLAGALWGLVFLVPELTRDFGPLHIAAGRYLVYGLIAIALLAPRWSRVLKGISLAQWRTLFGLGLLGNTIYYSLLSLAIQWVGIAVTSLIIGFIPVLVTLAGSRSHDAPSLGKLAPSLLLAVAAGACIAWQATFVSPQTSVSAGLGCQQIAGLVCACCSLISWSAFAVWNARCLAQSPHISSDDWNLMIGLVTGLQALLLIPVAFVLEGSAHDASAWLRLGALSAGSAVIASIFANGLWNRASRLLPLTLVGQMILFETLFALLYGFLWEQRWPTIWECLAMVFVVASVSTCLAVHTPKSSAQPSHG